MDRFAIWRQRIDVDYGEQLSLHSYSSPSSYSNSTMAGHGSTAVVATIDVSESRSARPATTPLKLTIEMSMHCWIGSARRSSILVGTGDVLQNELLCVAVD